MFVAIAAAWAPTVVATFVMAHINANQPIVIVIVGGVVAGMFSVVNTILNVRLLKLAVSNQDKLTNVERAADVIQMRKGDLSGDPRKASTRTDD